MAVEGDDGMRCVKCGHDEAEALFCPGGKARWNSLEPATGGTCVDHTGQELLHRKCENCSYCWDETPLDVSPPTKAEGCENCGYPEPSNPDQVKCEDGFCGYYCKKHRGDEE